VKGLEKLTSIRLAEVLTHREAVPNDILTDALYAHDRQRQSFVDTLVANGNITEWDLAKIVTEHFQLPFIMASNYEISSEAKERLPEEVLFQHCLVPLDVFGPAMTVAMPILMTGDQLLKVEREAKCDLFPYVGLTSENRKILQDMFPNYREWLAAEEQRRAEAAKQLAKRPVEENGDWMNMFDSADQEVRKGL